MKLFAFFIFILSVHIKSSAQSSVSFANKIFSKEELQTDFQVLRSRYENELANLYLYTSKPLLNKLFDSLYSNIQPMTAQEFYSYITPLSSVIKDGHSNIFPSETATDFYNQNSKFFPFNIYWSNEKMNITQNLSDDSTIEAGTKILFINGMSATDVMNYLLARQVRDGNNENYPLWILNNYFREYYSYHFGHPEKFQLVIETPQREIKSISVDALTKRKILANRIANEPTLNFSTASQQSFAFVIDISNSTAILTIKTWDNKKLKQEIKNSFAQLQSTHISNLIIDVRDNQGGNFKPAIYLLSFLLDKPFQYFTEVKTVSGSNDTSQLLKNRNGSMLGTHHSQKNIFSGKLYVLINGGCFSNTASFCSRIEFYKRGIFMGEETGGNKTIFSGEFGLKKFTLLPNTKIICENSNYQLTVTDAIKNNGHGVVPKYFVTPSVKSLIENTDEILNAALKLIGE